jgi:hypothetical protein
MFSYFEFHKSRSTLSLQKPSSRTYSCSLKVPVRILVRLPLPWHMFSLVYLNLQANNTIAERLWVPPSLLSNGYQGVNRSVREVDHSPPSTGAIPPLPQYVFMAWCLVKRRDNFTFALTFYGTIVLWNTLRSHYKILTCLPFIASSNLFRRYERRVVETASWKMLRSKP